MKNLKLSDIKNKINFEHGIYNEEKIKKFAVMALLSADNNGELSFIFQERNSINRQEIFTLLYQGRRMAQKRRFLAVHGCCFSKWPAKIIFSSKGQCR